MEGFCGCLNRQAGAGNLTTVLASHWATSQGASLVGHGCR